MLNVTNKPKEDLKCLEYNEQFNETKVHPCDQASINDYCNETTENGLNNIYQKLNKTKIESNKKEEEDFRTILNDIETKLKQTEFDLINGDYVIKEHCTELRRQVQLAKEIKIQQINNKSDQTISQIDAYETETLNAYSQVNKQEFNENLHRIKAFLKEWETKFADYKINSEEIREINFYSKEMQRELMVKQEKLKHLIFNGKLLNYRTNKFKVGKNLLGSLVPYPFETIVFHDLDLINFETFFSEILNKELTTMSFANIPRLKFLPNGDILFMLWFLNRNSYDLNIFLFNEYLEVKKRKIVKNFNNFKFQNGNSDKICLFYRNSNDTESFIEVIDDKLDTLNKIQIKDKRLIGACQRNIYLLSEIDQKPLIIYNWSLELISQIGQSKAANEPFYFPKNCVNLYSLESNNRTYFLIDDYRYLKKMEQTTGLVIDTMFIQANRTDLDSKNNIIVCEKNNSYCYYNSDFNYLKTVELIDFPSFYRFFMCLDQNDNLFFFDPSKFVLAI